MSARRHHGTVRGTVHTPGPCAVRITWFALDGRRLGRKRAYAGDFTLSLPAGSYFLEVEDERDEHDATRFTSAVVAVVVRVGQDAEVDVHLTRDTTHRPVEAAPVAAPAGVLQGRVVDARDGVTPLEGALVRLLDDNGRLVARARTNSTGHFAFEQLTTARDLQLLVRPAPATLDHSRLHLTGLTVVDDAWRDLGDLALPRAERRRRAPRVRSELGTAAALTLPALRV